MMRKLEVHLSISEFDKSRLESIFKSRVLTFQRRESIRHSVHGSEEVVTYTFHVTCRTEELLLGWIAQYLGENAVESEGRTHFLYDSVGIVECYYEVKEPAKNDVRAMIDKAISDNECRAVVKRGDTIPMINPGYLQTPISNQ